MLKKIVLMPNYAPIKNESYYAQNYASIMCQALYIVHMLWHDYRMSVSFENENKLHEYLHIIMFPLTADMK